MTLLHREFFLLGRRLAVTGSAWLKTQSVIFLMTSAFSMAGLLLIGNPYYILGGIGIGVLDALPIFGAGTALVPWSLFLLFKREWGHALILFGLYLLCYFLREFTEAHLMGKKMGLSPLETLAAIYVGLQLFGNGVLSGLGLEWTELMILAVSILFSAWVTIHNQKEDMRVTLEKKPIWLRWIALYALLFYVILLGKYGPGYSASEFIYQNFKV